MEFLTEGVKLIGGSLGIATAVFIVFDRVFRSPMGHHATPMAFQKASEDYDDGRSFGGIEGSA
jgi:hypothetical protein